MTLDLQQLIKFPVGVSFLSFETVQRSSPAMHTRQQWTGVEQTIEVFLSPSLSKCEPDGRNDTCAEHFQRILLMAAFLQCLSKLWC